MSTVDSGHCICIIQDNKYSIPECDNHRSSINMSGGGDKSCHNKKQVLSSKSGVRW